MAISTSSYFSNSLVGVPQVAGEYVDIFQVSATPKYALGTKYERQDGCVFRYAQFASNIAVSTVLATVSSDAAVGYVATNTAFTSSSTYQQSDEPSGLYPGAIGSRYVMICSTAAANIYAGGYLDIVAGTGYGYQYRIRANATTLASNAVKVSLYDQIVVAMDSTTVWAITPCKFNDLVAAAITTGATLGIAGVKVSGNTAGTGSQFGWIQTAGQALCLGDAATMQIGSIASISTTTAGYITKWVTMGTVSPGVPIMGNYPIIGYVTNVAGAATMATVALQLD